MQPTSSPSPSRWLSMLSNEGWRNSVRPSRVKSRAHGRLGARLLERPEQGADGGAGRTREGVRMFGLCALAAGVAQFVDGGCVADPGRGLGVNREQRVVSALVWILRRHNRPPAPFTNATSNRSPSNRAPPTSRRARLL